MKVLVACESSGTVRDAFLRKGHTAFSCDLLPSDDNSVFHLQCDVLEVLHEGWDLVIAHPPCTYLSVSGLHWNKRRTERAQKTEEAAEFFMKFADLECAYAIENPVCCMSTRWRKPDQIIQPYEYGHDASKKTCLWLNKLPKLNPTKYVEGRLVCCGEEYQTFSPHKFGGCGNCGGKNKPKMRWSNQTNSGQNNLPPSKDRWKIRSKTYEGIARAMADQWSNLKGE